MTSPYVPALDRDDQPHYVYELYAEDGTCLHVGLTSDLGLRLSQHGRKPWWKEVAHVESQRYPLRTGRGAEQERIKALNPLHNVLLKPKAVAV